MGDSRRSPALSHPRSAPRLRRRARALVALIAAAALAGLAAPPAGAATPVRAAPVPEGAGGASDPASTPEAAAIVAKIDKAVGEKEWNEARELVDELYALMRKVRETLPSTPRNRRLANNLQRLADVQLRKVNDAQIDDALRQPIKDDSAGAAQSQRLGESYLEAVVAAWVRELVLRFRVPIPGPSDDPDDNTEIDIETARAILEVTASKGGDKYTQVVGNKHLPEGTGAASAIRTPNRDTA